MNYLTLCSSLHNLGGAFSASFPNVKATFFWNGNCIPLTVVVVILGPLIHSFKICDITIDNSAAPTLSKKAHLGVVQVSKIAMTDPRESSVHFEPSWQQPPSGTAAFLKARALRVHINPETRILNKKTLS